MPIKDILAKHLLDERTKKNLLQDEVAHRAGISTRFYQSIENGDQQPTLHNFFRIIKALEGDFYSIASPIWQEWLDENNNE